MRVGAAGRLTEPPQPTSGSTALIRGEAWLPLAAERQGVKPLELKL